MQRDLGHHRNQIVLTIGIACALFASAAGAQEQTAIEGSGASLEVNVQVSASPAAEAAPAAAPTTPTRDDLVRSLGSLDVAARVEAARGLGALRDPATVPALSQALSADPDPIVRGWILRALHQINSPAARTAIAAAGQRDADERVRVLAQQLAPVVQTAPASTDPAMYAPVVTARQERIQGIEPQRPRRPGRGLRVLGWVLFAGTYGISFFVSMPAMMMDADEMWPLMLPVVGGAIGGTRVLREDDELVFMGIMGWLSSAIQITGLALAIAGHVRGRRAREGQSRSRNFAITPTAGPNGLVGLSAMGRF